MPSDWVFPIDDGDSTPLGDDAEFLHWLGEHQSEDPMFEKLMTAEPEPEPEPEVATEPHLAVEVRVRVNGEGLDQLVNSYQHVQDHGCAAGSEYLMGVIAAIIESASEQLFKDES